MSELTKEYWDRIREKRISIAKSKKVSCLVNKTHKWHLGKMQRKINIGDADYITRTDVCLCGCERDVEFDEEMREWLVAYTKDNVTSTERPQCTHGGRKN